MKIPFIDPSTRTETTGQENYKILNASKLDVNVSLHFRPQLRPGMILSLGWNCHIYYKGKKQMTFFRASNHSITEHDISPSDADLKKWVVGSFKRFSEQFEILRYNYRLSEVYFNDDALESNIDSLREVLLPLTQNKNIPACYQKITA